MALIKKIYSIAIGSTAMASTGAYASYLNRNTEIDNSKYKVDETKYRGVDYQISWESDDDSGGFLSKEQITKLKNEQYALNKCKNKPEKDCSSIKKFLNNNKNNKLFDFRFI